TTVVPGGTGVSEKGRLNTTGRYRHGYGNASRTMSRALFDTAICTDPKPSRHGSTWAWYEFIDVSARRGTSGARSTGYQGPHGFSATSIRNLSPQYPSI